MIYIVHMGLKKILIDVIFVLSLFIPKGCMNNIAYRKCISNLYNFHLYLISAILRKYILCML